MDTPQTPVKKKYDSQDVMNFYYVGRELQEAKRCYERAEHYASVLKDPELKEKAAKLLAGEIAP